MLAPLLLSLVQVSNATPGPAPALPPALANHHLAAPVAGPHRARRLFISPMGEPFRSTSRDDDTLADWFEKADKNHDGRLTIEEMQQDAERFFAILDVNHDGEIDPDEITHYENVVAPEIRTGEHYSLALLEGGAPGRTPGFLRGSDDPHQGAGRYGLLDLPEPVVSADADFDRGVSLTEFRQAAVQRFLALDLDHRGYLTLASLETIRPAPPPAPTTPNTSKQVDESALPSNPQI